jgi:hypothetical protein
MANQASEAAKERWARPEYRARQITSHRSTLTNEERFWAKVNHRGTDECWPWTGARDERGYGVFICRAENGEPQRRVGAHRLAYEWSVGPIAEGLTIDHLCRDPSCCNPAHLEPVTIGENIRRARAATNASHCPKGHEFTPENTYRKASHSGRICKTCNRKSDRERQREYRRSGRAEAVRAQWTPEQWEHHRRLNAEAARRRRAQSTPEQREAKSAYNREYYLRNRAARLEYQQRYREGQR